MNVGSLQILAHDALPSSFSLLKANSSITEDQVNIQKRFRLTKKADPLYCELLREHDAELREPEV